MTLLAHQTDQRFPSIAKGEARVHPVPLVPATRESLAGFGEIVPDFASAKVKMKPWPLKGWRPMSPGVIGNEAGEVEGAFSMWTEGGLLFGRNEAVNNKQGRVHACVDFNALTEFGCYLEVPLAR